MSRFEFELNFDSSIMDGISCCDEWGASYLFDNDRNVGVEYNLCVDGKNNCSAIYFTNFNGEYMETDYDKYIHYEIDFSDAEWKNKLEQAMLKALLCMEKIIHNVNKEHIIDNDVVGMVVYYDTINKTYCLGDDDREDDNIATVFVPKWFVEKYIEGHCFGRYNGYDDFMENYIADSLDDLYAESFIYGVMYGWMRGMI